MWNAISFALFECVCLDLFGQLDANTYIRLVFIFTCAAFLGLSHVTYCSETRDKKTAMRERDKFTGSSLLKL
jgi:hypothetical protein